MEKVKAVIDDSSSFTNSFADESSPPAPPLAPAGWIALASSPTVSSTPSTSDGLTTVEVLDELAQRVDGVGGSLLASVDGFGLACCSALTDDPSHPAMLAAAVGLAKQLAAMGGGTRLHQLVIDHDAGLLLVWPIGTQRVLAVLASTRVDQRQLRASVQSRASMLAGAVT